MADNNQESEIISKGLFWGIIITCILIFGAMIILFSLNREFDNEYPIDNGLFGTYGDFIGGVVGTIIAFYSAFLLVKTLQSQEKVNKNVIETNNSIIDSNNKTSIASEKQLYNTILEDFNNKFERFMACYQNAMVNYVFKKDHSEFTGRKAFEKMVNVFVNSNFTNNNDYITSFLTLSSRPASFSSKSLKNWLLSYDRD